MLFPIRIELRRSRCLLLLLVALHTAAAGSVWVLPWPLRSSLLAIIAISMWHYMRPSTVVGLRLSQRGGLRLLRAAGDSLAVSVRPETVVFNQLIVLRVRDDEHGRLSALTLLPDSMPAEQFRVLRLWLRWCADPSEPVQGDV